MSSLDDDDETQTGDDRENFYPDVYVFVDDLLAPLFAHEVNDQLRTFRWCSHWFLHTEAVARLEALWKAWEVLRLDPGTGASIWFRDHADPCMAALTSSEGPFRQCSDTKHRTAARLPLAPLPAGLGLSYKRADDDGADEPEVELTVRLTGGASEMQGVRAPDTPDWP